AARRERLLGVGDLADRTDARLAEMIRQALQEPPATLLVVRMQLHPGIEERPNEPRPYRSLMISGVARTQIAMIGRLVVRLARRPRTQAERSQQPLAHHVHHGTPALAFQDRIR